MSKGRGFESGAFGRNSPLIDEKVWGILLAPLSLRGNENRICAMPKTWAETHIHISDQLLEAVPETDHAILRELALDSLNNPNGWVMIGDGRRCAFLSRQGFPISIEIGVATIDSSLATVFSVRVAGADLSDVNTPLTRHDEFETDYEETDYESRSTTDRPVLKVRHGEARRMQPMKCDPED
jgi:hypothetical protein